MFVNVDVAVGVLVAVFVDVAVAVFVFVAVAVDVLVAVFVDVGDGNNAVRTGVFVFVDVAVGVCVADTIITGGFASSGKSPRPPMMTTIITADSAIIKLTAPKSTIGRAKLRGRDAGIGVGAGVAKALIICS